MTCPSSDPIDPRVRRTRKLLQDALRSLLHEKRLASISVQSITKRATVNRATFYAHYDDKDALVVSLFQDDLRSALIRKFPENPALNRANLTAFAVGVFEHFGSLHDACPETASELHGTIRATIQQGLYEHFDIWLSQSPAYLRLFPGCRKETIATVLSASLYAGVLRWSASSPRGPAMDFCREIVSILLPCADAPASAQP